MSPAFLRALEITLDFEGGFVNNPYDSGGATNRGITQRTYETWRKTTGQPIRSVADISDTEVQAIYFENYWTPCNCDDLPEPLSHLVFDMAVNSGVWNAKLALQAAVRVQQDGVIGPATIAAVNATPAVCLKFLKCRAALIGEILQSKPSQGVFAAGWIKRLLDQCWAAAR